MSENILIESNSPVCPIQACVEQSEDAVHFYLFFPYRKGPEAVRSCWVCNRKPAPAEINEHTWKKSTAPMMPRGSFSHAPGGIDIYPEGLKIVWYDTGDSAALMQNGEILALIPPWSGVNGFHGYAKYAVGTGLFAWEITAEGRANMMRRIQNSEIFWSILGDGGFWSQLLEAHADVLQRFYGPITRRAALNGKNFPPRELLEGKKNGVIYGITAFISAIPQPQIEMHIENADEYSHIEFGFAAEERFADCMVGVYALFSSLTRYLYGETTFFAHGHTNPYDEIDGFHALLFLNARMMPMLDSPDYTPFAAEGSPSLITGGSTVNLLWAVPVTKQEYDYAVENGSDALLARAKDIRRVHIFDGQPKFSI